MGISEDWADLMFNLDCLSKGAAKRKFRRSVKWAFGGFCAYCRSERATTLDHIKARTNGGSNLRSNLIPCCQECNHSKASEHWLTWFERQVFYNETARELIEEWISNKRFIEEELDERPAINRATVCSHESSIRSLQDEQECVGKDDLAVA